MADFTRIYKSDLSDRQLGAFWRLVLASGRGRAIGFDRPPMDEAAFCRWMRRPGVHPWLVAWRGVPVGLFYLTDVCGRSAHVHFCLLPCGTRRVSAPREAVAGLPGVRGRSFRGGGVPKDESAGRDVRLPLLRAAGLFALASALWEAPECGFRLDMLIGVTPQTNAAALAFVRSLGAQECGVVPGLCWLYDARRNVPAVVSVFDRFAVPQRAASL